MKGLSRVIGRARRKEFDSPAKRMAATAASDLKVTFFQEDLVIIIIIIIIQTATSVLSLLGSSIYEFIYFYFYFYLLTRNSQSTEYM